MKELTIEQRNYLTEVFLLIRTFYCKKKIERILERNQYTESEGKWLNEEIRTLYIRKKNES